MTVAERDVLLDLTKRAMVGAGVAGENRAWRSSELGQLAEYVERAPYRPDFSGALHIARNVRSFAEQIDAIDSAGTWTSIPRLDAVSTDICAGLERLARHVEGATTPGRNPSERIFYLPGWLLTERVHLSHRKPGTSLTTMQGFVVDATGVGWLGRYRQEQNFGGKYLLPLKYGGEYDARERAGSDTEPDTWNRIAERAYRTWNDFVKAVRRTSVFAAMQRLGRDDLRTALWLSRRGRHGEPGWLQLAENRPGLAAQILPNADRTDDWQSVRFHQEWKSAVEIERLCRRVEGSVVQGTTRDERIFYLPGWLLAERVDLECPRPGTVFTKTQGFEVDAIGVRWLEGHEQERRFGDRYTLPLIHGNGDRTQSKAIAAARERIKTDELAVELDMSERITARAYDHWKDFVDTVRLTRVFAAMRTIGRDDVRTALWLSGRQPCGELRRLQFTENLPELAAQILPLSEETDDWQSDRFSEAWKCVAQNAKPRRIAKRTWLGSDYAKLRVRDSTTEDRVLAQAVASGRHPVYDIWPDPPASTYLKKTLRKHQRRIIEAWNTLEPERLREQTWKRPLLVVGAVSAAVRVLGSSDAVRWIPASVIVRGMLNSGLGAVTRTNAILDLGRNLADAARDLYRRSLRPQLEMAGYNHPPAADGTEVEATLVETWLKLRFGLPAEREAAADELPNAAREAMRRDTLRPRWLDLVDWSRNWHHPPRLARAQFIVMAGDRRARDCERLATPLVLEAGGRLGCGVQRIETVPELDVLAHEEEHCIFSYVNELRKGNVHCLVLCDEDDKQRRSTVLIEERTQWVPSEARFVLGRQSPYRVNQIRMRRNGHSPREHRVRAEEIAREWCRLAATKGVLRASPEETRRRVDASRPTGAYSIPLHSVQKYWAEVSRDCIPEWLQDFDPAQGLLPRLYRESLGMRAR